MKRIVTEEIHKTNDKVGTRNLLTNCSMALLYNDVMLANSKYHLENHDAKVEHLLRGVRSLSLSVQVGDNLCGIVTTNTNFDIVTIVVQ